MAVLCHFLTTTYYGHTVSASHSAARATTAAVARERADLEVLFNITFFLFLFPRMGGGIDRQGLEDSLRLHQARRERPARLLKL
jgi:hypothetical protein